MLAAILLRRALVAFLGCALALILLPVQDARATGPTVQFSAATVTVYTTAGSFSLTVTLSATIGSSVTVPFTLGGNAVSGTDYSGVTASPLSIPGGQTSGAISGTLLSNPGADKTLTVTLGNPTNATLGSPAIETVTIRESPPAFVVDAITDPTSGTASKCITLPTNGMCTLRDAIAANDAVGGSGTITFDASVFATPQTITLNQSAGIPTLTPAQRVTIDGTGHTVVVDGGCTFNGTICTSGGTRVFLVNSGVTVNLTALTIQHGNSGADGGGIFNSGGTLTVTNSTLAGNNAAASGGGIDNYFGALTMTNSTLSGNTASNGGGGGIENYIGATLTVTNSTLSGNIAGSGGGIENFRGAVTVTNSTLSGNSAGGGGGGGIFNQGGSTLTVTNSTLSGNSAPASFGGGGGIANYGTLTVTNSTFSGNSASNLGGGILNNFTLTVTNTIVAGNSASNGGPDLNGTITSGGHNLIGKTDTSSGWIGSDLTGTVASPLNPQLGTLSNNGGPTQTIPLLTGSPATAHGDPTVCDRVGMGKVGGVDQRGVTRPTALCAIGAFEPTLSAIGPIFGAPAGGTTVTLTGAGFVVNGTLVSIGGVACTNVQVASSTSLTCVTGAHAAAGVDVLVTVSGGATGTLTGGYTYGTLTPLPGPKPPGGTQGGPPNPLPGSRPSGTTGGPAPNPLPAPRP